ncbi:hypothetical protein DMB38_13035 [Streptomyces sp. WAC 06738]|nr:hypothetical protein DMB38_13035 [Streptomyces sp. WAC 06738]
MCVRVLRSALVTAPWVPETRTITVPALLDAERTLRAVRGVLAELGVEQPTFGAVCWCGQPVAVSTDEPRVPNQRRSTEVVTRGA